MAVKKLVIMSLFLIKAVHLNAENRSMHDVFGRWINPQSGYCQKIFHDVDLNTIPKKLTRSRCSAFNKYYKKYNNALKPMNHFFDYMGTDKLLHATCKPEKFSKKSKRMLKKMFYALEDNPLEFLQLMQQAGIRQYALNHFEEQQEHYNDTIQRYNKFLSALTTQKTSMQRQTCMFAIANRLFEFCTSPKHCAHFCRLLEKEKNHPLGRMLASIIWYNFAGRGWKQWHKNTLTRLEKICQNPQAQVTYIAGGSDLYHLLDHRIFNIRVIDPMLPTQNIYYSEGWDWLVHGNGPDHGINDECTVTTQRDTLVLKRVKHAQHGTFKARLDTQEIVELPHTTTHWDVINQKTGEKVGTIIFERRFCHQDDFIEKPHDNILVAYNEMYYLTTKEDDHWGINPRKFSPHLKIHIKQLRRPVKPKHLINFGRIEKTPLNFIRMGSQIG